MSAAHSFKLLIYSAKQVVQVVKNGETVVKGACMNHVEVLESSQSCGLSVVVSKEGIIHDIGNDEEILKKYESSKFDQKIDASGACILPGLVDAHTHPVWAGDRVNEFAMKLAGATYLEVHKAGGGINFTVDHTRRASEDYLLDLLLSRLDGMLKCGTTLVEAKSGYGLDTESEIKLLRVIELAKRKSKMEISTTFCGAHAIPRGKSAEEATEDIVNKQLPLIKELMDKGDLNVDNIDVFCEKGIFEIDQSRRILEAGRKLGLKLNFHGDELHPLGSAEMGAELQAEAISHLEEISAGGIKAMSESGSVAVILPTTAYILKLRPPPVRQMIAAGVPVALGSDFNPNAFCMSMPLVMHLACIVCGMSMAEALNAATINAAASLGKSKTHGSIEIGKVADIIVINAERWEHLIYQMGAANTLIKHVIKHGNVVFSNVATKMV